MKTINIIDTGCDRYTIKSDCYFLGRQWDNLAEQMQIVIPEREKDHTCTMIVSADGVVIDHLDIKNEPKDITNVLSRHLNIEISFTFTDINGYVKNSQIKEFYFAEARKPEDFIPSEPEQSSKLDIVLGNAFIRADVEDDILKFYNANGDVAQSIPLPTVGGGGQTSSNYNDLNNKPMINDITLQGNKSAKELGLVDKESDPTVPSHVKSITQQNINTWNNKADVSYVNGQKNEAVNESKAYTDKKYLELDNNKADLGYVESIESIAKGANQAVSFDNYSKMITKLNGLSKDVYNVGQNVMIVTLNVPDLWISQISDTNTNYSYTSDNDFISELKTNGSVQVGYYILSALETQKVNLDNYIQKDVLNDYVKEEDLPTAVKSIVGGHITLTQAEYDALVTAGTVDEDTYYYIKG